ncbi:unnamed protein product [Lampetra planeri]
MSAPVIAVPLKVLAVQLSACPGARPDDDDEKPPHTCVVTRSRGATQSGFEPRPGCSPLRASYVWMQGDVVSVEESHGGSARISDDTGKFTVRGLDSVPRGSSCLAPGEYVLVYGAVVSCGPDIIIKATKVTGLTSNPSHRAMWRAEVADLQQNLP